MEKVKTTKLKLKLKLKTKKIENNYESESDSEDIESESEESEEEESKEEESEEGVESEYIESEINKLPKELTSEITKNLSDSDYVKFYSLNKSGQKIFNLNDDEFNKNKSKIIEFSYDELEFFLKTVKDRKLVIKYLKVWNENNTKKLIYNDDYYNIEYRELKKNQGKKYSKRDERKLRLFFEKKDSRNFYYSPFDKVMENHLHGTVKIFEKKTEKTEYLIFVNNLLVERKFKDNENNSYTVTYKNEEKNENKEFFISKTEIVKKNVDGTTLIIINKDFDHDVNLNRLKDMEYIEYINQNGKVILDIKGGGKSKKQKIVRKEIIGGYEVHSFYEVDFKKYKLIDFYKGEIYLNDLPTKYVKYGKNFTEEIKIVKGEKDIEFKTIFMNKKNQKIFKGKFLWKKYQERFQNYEILSSEFYDDDGEVIQKIYKGDPEEGIEKKMRKELEIGTILNYYKGKPFIENNITLFKFSGDMYFLYKNEEEGDQLNKDNFLKNRLIERENKKEYFEIKKGKGEEIILVNKDKDDPTITGKGKLINNKKIGEWNFYREDSLLYKIIYNKTKTEIHYYKNDIVVEKEIYEKLIYNNRNYGFLLPRPSLKRKIIYYPDGKIFADILYDKNDESGMNLFIKKYEIFRTDGTLFVIFTKGEKDYTWFKAESKTVVKKMNIENIDEYNYYEYYYQNNLLFSSSIISVNPENLWPIIKNGDYYDKIREKKRKMEEKKEDEDQRNRGS